MNSPRSFRTTELVKEFARQGHDVTLFTLKDKKYHEHFAREYGVQIEDLGPLHFPEVSLNVENKVINYFERIFRRGFNLFFEYPDIELMFQTRKALKTENGYDLLITIAMPHTIHWGAAFARKPNHRIAETWVADCGDPYMGQTLDSFKKMFYFGWFEKLFCKKADWISVPVEEAKMGYYPEYRNKIQVVPQGFNFNEVEIDQDSYKEHNVPTFAYAGGLIPGGRDPSKFLEYVTGLDCEFTFILYTKNRSLVEPWLEKAAGRIEVRDYIPREELLKVLSRMDFLINFENSSSLMSPSKLIDYYLTGRPVMDIGSQSIDRKKIDLFLKGDYQKRHHYNGIDKYRIESVAEQFLNLCS